MSGSKTFKSNLRYCVLSRTHWSQNQSSFLAFLLQNRVLSCLKGNALEVTFPVPKLRFQVSTLPVPVPTLQFQVSTHPWYGCQVVLMDTTYCTPSTMHTRWKLAKNPLIVSLGLSLAKRIIGLKIAQGQLQTLQDGCSHRLPYFISFWPDVPIFPHLYLSLEFQPWAIFNHVDTKVLKDLH